MDHYKFCFERGAVFRTHRELLLDDLSALDVAKKLCAEYLVEIWQGDRQVGRVKQHDEPLNNSDRHSL